MQEKISQGYKQTEVGVIPEDWDVVPIGGLGEVRTGGTPPTNRRELYGGGYLFVSPADIGANKYINRTEKTLSLEGFRSSRIFPAGSSLFVCIGSTIGKVGLAAVDLCSNQQINSVSPGENVDSEFLYYSLLHASPRIAALAGEQAVPIINKSAFSANLIALPGKGEQLAIAEALSDADARIEALEALLAKKRDLKQAAMQQLLTGKIRLPGFSGDWEVKRLGEFAQFLSGSYLAKQAYRPGTVVVQGAGAAMGEHDTANLPFAITVIGRVGTVGRPRFMRDGCWVNNNAAAIRALPSEADPRFVHLLLTQYDWSLATSVTAQPFLGIGTLMGSTHFLPPKVEQTAIAEVVFDMDAELSSLEAEADKARAIKQGMMQNLLTGKVRLV